MQTSAKLIVFDLDGTLNRTDLFSVECHKTAMTEFGLPVKTREEICATYGMRAKEFVKILTGIEDPVLARKYLDRVSALEPEMLKKYGKAFDGTAELLSALKKQHILTAVCSNASYRYISLVLKELKLFDSIDFIQPLGKNQTKIDTLRVLLRHTHPEQAVMVGDTLFDITAGRENGLKTVGCLYGYRPDEARQADFHINKPLELIDLLPELF